MRLIVGNGRDHSLLVHLVEFTHHFTYSALIEARTGNEKH